MPSVGERLRALDRKVLRDGKPWTAEQYAKAVRRHPLLLGVAVAEVVVAYVVVVVYESTLVVLTLGVFAVLLAYQAGQLKGEDDRVRGRGLLGRQRPPGL